MSARTAVLLTGLLLVLIIGSKSLYIVNETERGLLLRFGEVVNPDIEPGLHFMYPIVNEVHKFDGRIQTLDVRPQDYLTLEKKRLIVDSFLKWKISNVKSYYTATSGDESRAGDILSSRVDSGLRNHFGQRTLNEVVSGERDELILELREALTTITQEELGIKVIDIRLKRIDLPSQVSQSVYDRMRTERELEARALRAQGQELAEGIRADADRQRTVILAEAFRTAEIARGEGDAAATAIYAEAHNRDSEFYSFYRSLNAYKSTFSTKRDVMILEPNSDFFKYLNNSKGKP